jgi:hypothetical protein
LAVGKYLDVLEAADETFVIMIRTAASCSSSEAGSDLEKTPLLYPSVQYGATYLDIKQILFRQ